MLKISVLLAIKKSRRHLEGCLESLLSQTLLDQMEILVISYHANNQEIRILTEARERFDRVRHIPVEQEGLYYAWNIGIKAANGDYLINLNADDRLTNNAVEILSQTLDENPDVSLVYGNSFITSLPGGPFAKKSRKRLRTHWPPYSHKGLLTRCICGPHPMWRRSVHREIGYFDETFKIAGDYEFWLRLGEKHRLLGIPDVIGLYYLNPHGLSIAYPQALTAENLTIKKRYLTGKPRHQVSPA